MKIFLIEFKHDSKFLGQFGYGQLLVQGETFEDACAKVVKFSVPKVNKATGYTWNETFTNARDFVNLTIR